MTMAWESYRKPCEPTGKMIRLVLVHQREYPSSNSLVLRHPEFLCQIVWQSITCVKTKRCSVPPTPPCGRGSSGMVWGIGVSKFSRWFLASAWIKNCSSKMRGHFKGQVLGYGAAGQPLYLAFSGILGNTGPSGGQNIWKGLQLNVPIYRNHKFIHCSNKTKFCLLQCWSSCLCSGPKPVYG